MTRVTSERTRLVILLLNSRGLSQSKIASKLKVNQSTVSRILKLAREKCTLSALKSPGRPQALSPKEKREIQLFAKREPRVTADEIKKHIGLKVSNTTISKALKEGGLGFNNAKNKPLISEKNRKARLEFVKKYVNKDLDFWKEVIFADESKFCQRSDARKVKVLRNVIMLMSKG